MEIDRKELKRRAREAMGLTSPKFWGVALVYLLLTYGIRTLAETMDYLLADPNAYIDTLGLFLSILVMLLTTVLQFGYNLWSLWAYRRLNPGLGALAQSFSVAGRVIIMQLLIFVRVLAWSLCLSAAVVFVVMIPSVTVYVLVLLLIYVAVIAIMLRYAMAPYLLADYPDDGAGAAVRRSVEMMRGHKWELFKLQLSFLGWHLINAVLSGAVMFFFLHQGGGLSVLLSGDTPRAIELLQALMDNSLAITLSSLVTLPLSLWLTPYITVSEAGFYDSLCQIPRYDTSEMPPL